MVFKLIRLTSDYYLLQIIISVNILYLFRQGMVHGKTYYLKKTGQYLRTDEINKYSSDELKVKWQKMSKSKHNGVDPDSCIEDYGADVVRAFMLFKV